MYTGDILRSARTDTLFEGRIPAVVLDLSRDFRKLTQTNTKTNTKKLFRENIQRYFDSLLWSLEKDEWNHKMTDSDKDKFVDVFYDKLCESADAKEAQHSGKEFKVKNTIECDLCNEQVTVSYNAYRRSKRNVDMFNTVDEASWLDLSEVISDGINILDDLSETEKRQLIDQCWDDAEELIDISNRTRQ